MHLLRWLLNAMQNDEEQWTSKHVAMSYLVVTRAVVRQTSDNGSPKCLHVT